MMKRFAIPLLLLFVGAWLGPFSNLFGQSFQSIFGPGTTNWDVIFDGQCDAICSETATVTGDTVILGAHYKLVDRLEGYLREDTVLGKVWFLDSIAQREYLVMDLSLQVGDTFVVYDWGNIPSFFVADSVYVQSGLRHVRLTAKTVMCALEEKLTFIEGSGTTAFFHYHHRFAPGEIHSYMLCHNVDGAQRTGNLLFPGFCFTCNIAAPEPHQIPLSITASPNPAAEVIHFSMPETSPRGGVLEVYNAHGEWVLRQVMQGNDVAVSIAQLPSGMYWAVVQRGGNRATVKFMRL